MIDYEPSTFITYLDNNLYGWTMSEYLPYAEFDWFDVNSINEKSDTG